MRGFYPWISDAQVGNADNQAALAWLKTGNSFGLWSDHNDSLEEIFENKEQIEVSKFYESLPKPHALAVEEWLQNRVYHRKTEQ